MNIKKQAEKKVFLKTIHDWSDEFDLWFGDFDNGKSGYPRYEDAVEAEIEWLKENGNNENLYH